MFDCSKSFRLTEHDFIKQEPTRINKWMAHQKERIFFLFKCQRCGQSFSMIEILPETPQEVARLFNTDLRTAGVQDPQTGEIKVVGA